MVCHQTIDRPSLTLGQCPMRVPVKVPTRYAAPRELEGQVTKLIREFLLTLRSLIDWYLERLDRPRRDPQVEDIPIE